MANIKGHSRNRNRSVGMDPQCCTHKKSEHRLVNLTPCTYTFKYKPFSVDRFIICNFLQFFITEYKRPYKYTHFSIVKLPTNAMQHQVE